MVRARTKWLDLIAKPSPDFQPRQPSRPPSMPGPRAADLIFSEQANHNFSKTLGALKRSTFSIVNRLQSIQQDAAFAQTVAHEYGRPLIANERCGSWYVDPQYKGGSAYFKSTDGHTSVWKFSTRRLNLHLLQIIGKHDGCIIVDSTRRGKRMPDALSKTIPIWCAVLNRLLFADLSQCHELYTPTQVVSPSEHAQIVDLLSSFSASLEALHLSVESLKSQIAKPLRPIWVTPDSNITRTESVFKDFHPIICCTVSRRVAGVELSEGGYIQGAGDDIENWALGLKPSIFWANHATLLSTPEVDLPDLIKLLIDQSANAVPVGHMNSLKPTSCLFVGTLSGIVNTGIAPCIIHLLPKATNDSTWHTSESRLDIGLGSHKTGSRNLRLALPEIAAFVEKHLVPAREKQHEHPIILACESGKDLSVGAALALLCLFFAEDGGILNAATDKRSIDKTFIRRRLGWISASVPDANPSRTTLQSVNSFLMERL